jgi:hypothetical protein
MKPFIGLKKIWYGEPLTEAPTSSTISSLVAGMTEVKNVHDGTWSYTQEAPSITDYINELTGQPYYRDITNGGNKTIEFTMGEYEFSDLAAFQGGKEEGGGWASGAPQLIYKSIVAMTKTGNYIVFTNAGVTGMTNTTEKNLGLGVTAVAMDSSAEGVAAEYRFAGNAE